MPPAAPPAPPLPQPATGGVVAALIENRAGEVGVAFWAPDTVRLTLSSVISASHSHSAVGALLSAHRAAGTLVCLDSAAAGGGGPLSAPAMLLARGAVARLAPLPRSAFDDAEGALALERLAIAGTAPPVSGPGRPPYLALAAAAALLTHLGRAAPPDGTAHVVVAPPGSYLSLDPSTIAALHLIRGPGGRRAGSVLATLDSTRTTVGSAWLRAAVLQPLAHAPSLRLRHAAVAELVADPSLAASIDSVLASLPRELGRLYGWLALRPKTGPAANSRSVAGLARSLTLLRTALAALPGLAAVLSDARSELLRTAGATLAHPAVAALGPALDTVLGVGGEAMGDGDGDDENATNPADLQDCFVVRTEAAVSAADTTAQPILTPNDAALLAAAREALTAAVSAAATLATSYRAAAGPAARNLRLHHGQRRGFWLTLPLKRVHATSSAWRRDLPAGLTITATRGGCVELTAAELGAANARAKAAAEDCLALSAAALSAAADRVTTGDAAAALQKAVDAIAVVDFLTSLARAACACPVPVTAPTMAEPGGATVFAGLRDPLLLSAAAASNLDAGAVVRANDAAFSPSGASLAIITGANSSGKSTYLRSVGTAVILAHVGAHVPAAHATVAVVHRVSLCGSAGEALSLETGESALGVEMRGVAAALSHAGPGTLLLLDEPGRATSTADGAALAWAGAEAALAARAPTLVATHFPRLARLADVYPTARAFHMDARLEESGVGEGGGGGGPGPASAQPQPPIPDVSFTWRLRPGPCTARHYGLAVAPRAGMPEDVVEEAAAIARRIEAEGGGGGEGGESTTTATTTTPHTADHALHSVAHRLAALANAWVGGAADADVAVALRGLQAAAVAAVGGGGGAA